MFGHDDQKQHQHSGDLPSPDVGVTDGSQIGGTPPMDNSAGDYIDSDTPASSTPSVTAPQTDLTADAGASSTPHPNADHLLDIKQQALQQLTPLIGHLEQTPEEKFRTTMMMIQASDNDELIKAAYEAAVQIPDEKVRAQALLDIVNEINYFTHSGQSNADA